MTPVANTESGRAAPALGANMSGDRDGVAVLDEDGVVVFTGCAADAAAYMGRHGLAEHCNAEVIENRAYMIGFEAF